MFQDDFNEDEESQSSHNPKMILQSYYQTLHERLTVDGTFDVMQANLLMAMNRWIYQSVIEGNAKRDQIDKVFSPQTIDMMSHMLNATGLPGIEREDTEQSPWFRIKFKSNDLEGDEIAEALKEFCSYGFDLYFSGAENAKNYEEITGKPISPCDCDACHAVNCVCTTNPELTPGIYDAEEAARLTEKVIQNLDALDQLTGEGLDGAEGDSSARKKREAINPEDVEDFDDLMDRLFNPED